MAKQRTFVPEDLYRMVLVGDPQISPDGRSVAFVRSHVEGEKKELRSHIWLVPGTTEQPRPYTRGPRSDSQPRWSPDGRRLAFVRQTGDGPQAERQIWIIERDGGEAYRLTTMRHGAGNPVWSPDGRYLAFVSGVDDAYMNGSETTAAVDPVRPKTEADRKREARQARDEAKLVTRFRYKFDHTGLFPARRSHVWVVRVPDTPPMPAMAVTDAEAVAMAEAAAAVEEADASVEQSAVEEPAAVERGAAVEQAAVEEADASVEQSAVEEPAAVERGAAVEQAAIEEADVEEAADAERGAAVEEADVEEPAAVERAAAVEQAAAAVDHATDGGSTAAPDDTGALPVPVQVTSGPFDHQVLDWSPDARWLAVASSHEDERTPNMDIWLYPVPSTEDPAAMAVPASPIRLTDSDGVFGDARWSPDGKHIAVIGHHREYRFATLSRLWLFPAPGHNGAKACLTPTWDRDIGGTVNSDVRPGMGGSGLTWAPDGKSIYFVGDDRGATQLYRIDVGAASLGANTSDPEQVGDAPPEPVLVAGGPREIYGFSLSADGQKAALAVSEPANPGDIILADPRSTGGETRLTFSNERLLRDIVQPEIMEIEFESHDGLPIHGWIMKPIGFQENQRYPAVLQIHGGPHTCWGYAFSLEMQLQAAMGCAVIFVNPRGSTSYGQEFTFGCVDDYGGADYKDLMAAVDYAVSLGFIDENRLAVTGGSYGGFMTNWIVTQTNRFNAAIPHRSISNWISFWGVSDIGPTFLDNEFGADSLWSGFDDMWERSPLKHAQNIDTPMLICHSEHDLRCPMEQAEQLYLALKWQDKPVELLRHPRSNHDLTRTGPPTLRVDRFRHIARFLKTHLLAEKTTG